MNRNNSPWRSVQSATVHWNEVGVPVSDAFNDVYYSQDNGLDESRHVFLQGNNLPQRWHKHPQRHFCVGELGFGTGLNFLLTWQAWRELPEPRPDLHYISIEKHPLTHADLAMALTAWPTLAALATRLLDAYPGLLAGQHRVLLDHGRVRLDLWWEDAAEALPDLAGREQRLVDAWYLDGFAPSHNATMWAAPLLQAAAALSRPGATLATFTVAGHVRRNLAAAGFQVEKVPGYGRKRECLRGRLRDLQAPSTRHDTSPWDIRATTPDRPESVLVVGAGLAGCHAAAALARRGITVTLLDQGSLAGAGSGNDQGVLYTRLSRKHSVLVDFALQSFQFASNLYRQMFLAGTLTAPLDGDLCGSFQQSDNAADMAALGAALVGLEELAQVLDATRANSVLGIDQPSAGYWYPRSGWLRPSAVCRSLVTHTKIRVVEHCGAVTLRTDGERWQAVANGQILAQATCAIAATGTQVAAMPQLKWLPVQTVRGQITQLPATHTRDALRAVLCHEGYIAPARDGSHSIGATFDINALDPAPRTQDHRENLARLAAAVPSWRDAFASLDPAALDGRVGYRCASPDYLPMVGPVPDVERLCTEFGALRKSGKQPISRRGSYLPGLYISTAHGSRGLTSTPIAAELLASMICSESPPFSRALCRALAPARFIIRDLTRNRI
jgi:tRNA 5-methylaminomethyl-2-thiouridine biosynthesis bifunctional protein